VAAFVSLGVRSRSKTRTFVFLAGFRKQPFSDFCLFASKDIRVFGDRFAIVFRRSQITPDIDMKKNLILSVIISFAMICSCQKQDSAAEQQLAQQKAALDAREKALDERVNALDESVNVLNGRVNALAEKQNATANVRTIPTDPQTQISDPAQIQAERDAVIQQLSAEIRARIPDDSKMKADGEMERQAGLEQPQGQRQPKLEMSGGAIFPAPEATSPTPSPAVETTSPTQSPTPQ
jgi:hypothetical protein